MIQRRDLAFELLTEESFADIPRPALSGARCQTCDYWERLEGDRRSPEKGASAGADAARRAELKRSRLLAGAQLAGSYAMLAYLSNSVSRAAVGYAQFGPLSAYPRAQMIRDRYRTLPESPAPWVVTCLQVVTSFGTAAERAQVGSALLSAVCDELDRRGITAVEAYPEGVQDAWMPSPGPASVYAEAGFQRAEGDEHYPVYRRELTGGGEVGWGDLLAHSRPEADDDEAWPLPQPKGPGEEDLFRLPQKPKRPNPFGED